MNKLTLEIELPTNLSDKVATSLFLAGQIEFITFTLKETLKSYKEKGVEVPILSLKRAAIKQEPNEEFKVFRNALIDHLLKYQPKVAVGAQMRAIKDLYALGKPAEYWIELFEESYSTYPLTTWFTVRHRLVNKKEDKEEEEETQFTRKDLNEKEIEEIRARLKG